MTDEDLDSKAGLISSEAARKTKIHSNRLKLNLNFSFLLKQLNINKFEKKET